jgi:hypothetical protein
VLDDNAVNSEFELRRMLVDTGVGDEVTEDLVLLLGQTQSGETEWRGSDDYLFVPVVGLAVCVLGAVAKDLGASLIWSVDVG